MSVEHALGYKDALEAVDKRITRAIKENGGATTPLQMVNVLNQTIRTLHEELLSVNNALHDMEYYKVPTPEPIEPCCEEEEALFDAVAFDGISIEEVTRLINKMFPNAHVIALSKEDK